MAVDYRTQGESCIVVATSTTDPLVQLASVTPHINRHYLSDLHLHKMTNIKYDLVTVKTVTACIRRHNT